MKLLERKEDTRRKIGHGGLVKKAGLDRVKPNVLLGLLIDANEKMSGEDGESFIREWRLKGDIALTMNTKIETYEPS